MNEEMQSILRCGGFSDSAAERVRFVGSDPVLPSPYRLGTAGAAALGALGVAMGQLREHQTGRCLDVEINVRAAAASLRCSRYIKIDGKPVKTPEDTITGFYPVAGGRWIYLHCNLLVHQNAVLRVLGVPADRSAVAAAALNWQPWALEQAVDEAGGCAPAVRTPEEWQALPNTRALASEPLVDIRKIADGAPMALPGGDRPLSGIRALDLTRVLAGPSCARMLAEYGVDVLKITCEQHPDFKHFEGDTGFGKRRTVLDIASRAGREQFTALLRDCDVFCQAYRPAAMRGLGYSPLQVANIRPGIVYTSLNAFGYTGELRERRGFDTVIQSACGIAHVSGRGKQPKFYPASALDYLAGELMVFGTLVALTRRAREGGSYAVNVSLARTAEWLTAMGRFDDATVDAIPPEFTADELSSWTIDVASPLGKLTRLRPIIRYSDGLLRDLPLWQKFDETRAVWAN